MKDHFKQTIKTNDYVIINQKYNINVGKIIKLMEPTATTPSRASVSIEGKTSLFNTCNIVKIPKSLGQMLTQKHKK